MACLVDTNKNDVISVYDWFTLSYLLCEMLLIVKWAGKGGVSVTGFNPVLYHDVLRSN